jgi:hypothetical protein
VKIVKLFFFVNLIEISEGTKFGFTTSEENLYSLQRRFVTAGVAAGVRRSCGGYCSTATVYLSLYHFFLVVNVSIILTKRKQDLATVDCNEECHIISIGGSSFFI